MVLAANILPYLAALAVTKWEEIGVNDFQPRNRSIYDFVVVGGGSAGSALASRLSENDKFTVLLLESGGSGNNVTDVPFLWQNIRNTPITVVMDTVPQKTTCLDTDGLCEVAYGNTLGGGSVHNGMFVTRGNPLDYDNWEALGAKGWSYKDVLPYLKKLEDVSLTNKTYSDLRGMNGPMKVSTSFINENMTNLWLQSVRQMGLKVGDYNGEEPVSFNMMQVNIDGQHRRVSTQRAYLDHAMQRKNLDIVSFARVNRVLFNGTRAIGVEYLRKNEKHVAYVNKEVIVSAGTLTSPKILQLSGVGPAHLLKKHGIPLVAHVPGVGENFHTHLSVYLNYDTNSTGFPTLDADRNDLNNYLEHGTGKLSTNQMVGLGYARTKYASANPIDTSVMYTFTGYKTPVDGRRSNRKTAFKDVLEFGAVGLLHKSKGYVRINSSNPNDHPLIDPNYGHHKVDTENLIEGVKIMLDFAKTDAFKAIAATPSDGGVQQCQDMKKWTRRHIKCLIKYASFCNQHYVGTCKMGSRDDHMAVVSHDLKVRGVQGLRVVDASVIPQVVRSSTNFVTIMVAEKAADMIKAEYNVDQ